jgi:nitrate reductase delta subunit
MGAVTFRVLSVLLAYPSEEMTAAAPDLRHALAREGIVEPGLMSRLDGLIEELASSDIYDLQERYGLLFDRTRSLALHLFEHVHGESRDRGQAMVDLRSLYEKAGLEIAANELPDYLPLFLEFLSTQPVAEARVLLSQTAHILQAMAERLVRRDKPYEAVFRALVALAATLPAEEEVAELLKGPDPDPTDLEALDAAWHDEEVRFGPGAQGAMGSCSQDGLIARMRHARRAVPQNSA